MTTFPTKIIDRTLVFLGVAAWNPQKSDYSRHTWVKKKLGGGDIYLHEEVSFCVLLPEKDREVLP